MKHVPGFSYSCDMSAAPNALRNRGKVLRKHDSREVRREKVRRVRVAALTVEGEGCRALLFGEGAEGGETGAVAFS